MITSLLLVTALQSFNVSDLDLSKIESGWGAVKPNLSISGKPLKIGGQVFENGLGTHAPSELIIDLERKATRFRAMVGIDANSGGKSRLGFTVWGDGKVLWASGPMYPSFQARECSVSLVGIKTLVLKVDDGGDGYNNDHADWGDAKIITQSEKPKTLDILPGQERNINPGKRWLDSKGEPIQAHSGGILQHNGRFYWFGEERTLGYNNKTGVAAYSSTDLVHWKKEGIVMPKAAFPSMFQDSGVCERPKVVYNRKTKKFVMWSHLDADSYRNSKAGVAVSDHVTGPFVHVRDYQPVPGQTYRDMNLFVDDDGVAYVYYSSEENRTMYVHRLTEDYLSHEPVAEGKTWAKMLVDQAREAPAPFKFNGKYYIITSGCTGWSPNPASYAVADHPLGPWTTVGNPISGFGDTTTFRSQSTFVFQPKGAAKNKFIFMADRWNSENLADSRYIWLPLEVKHDGKLQIDWLPSWHPKQYLR
jgi:hypothetical protein